MIRVRIIGRSVVAAALLASVAALPGQTTPAPADRIAELSKQVLADPTNAPACEQLAALREDRARQRQASLQALADGLTAYLAGRTPMAAPLLREAGKSPYVRQVAENSLGRRLDDLVVGANGAAGRCDACGDTGRADCPATGCYATGQTICQECSGRGIINRAARVTRCPVCRGDGTVVCTKCQGSGTVACTECGGVRAVGLTARQVVAARRTIAVASYLHARGADLFTRDALTTSQRP